MPHDMCSPYPGTHINSYIHYIGVRIKAVFLKRGLTVLTFLMHPTY